MNIRVLISAAAILLALTACGDDRSALRTEIAEDMARSTQGAISASEAECLADAMIDALGVEQASLYHRATTGDLQAAADSEPLTPEQQQKMTEGMTACDPGID